MDGVFEGTIGPTWRESTPWWPPEPSPPPGAPNVLVIVLDDVGFAQLGCYGSDIETPNIDALAASGVRLANFHTTSLCSPTRACLLTGRNHHANGMGRVADLAIGYPGYDGRIPRANGFLSEILGASGWIPVAVGKWHLTPEDETHMAAPRGSWPCGRGFQRWYGFHGGETHQLSPVLYEDNSAVPPRPSDAPYHLTDDLADRAIAYLGDIRAVTDSPFLCWFATGACHSPHQPPRRWLDRYRGRFDDGWDVWRERTFARQQALGVVRPAAQLSARPPWVPGWDDLHPDDRAVAARFMECFAAFLSHADEQIGRVLAFVDELGERDDTLVVLVSDNGASAEGGERGSINDVRTWNGMPAGRKELRARIDELGAATTHTNYPWGWTMAGNTPFRRWKREVHEGGVVDPCIVRWPRRLAAVAGGVRHQFAHAVDVVPTVLELVGLEAPAQLGGVTQRPLDGVSFASVLHDAAAPPAHVTQYFEMFGSRGIYHDGWKAVAFKPMAAMYGDGVDPDAPFDDDVWELYDVVADPSECVDLAASHPEKVAELVDLWWREARRHQVLPLDNRPLAALEQPRPGGARAARADRAVLRPTGAAVPELVAPVLRDRPHAIRAHVESDGAGIPDGVLLAMGSALGGWSLHVLDGRLRYVHNLLGMQRSTAVSDPLVLAAGPHVLGMRFEPTGAFRGRAHLEVDGVDVAAVDVPMVAPVRHSITGGGMTCGWEQGPAVGDGYDAPFRFTGVLRHVVVEAGGAVHRDLAAELEAIMSEQ